MTRWLVALAFVSYFVPAVTAASDRAETFVFDPKTRECISCGQSKEAETVRSVVWGSPRPDVNTWILERFKSLYVDNQEFMRSLMLEDPIHGLTVAMGMDVGVAFALDGRHLRYQMLKCRFWDCYKEYLSLIEASGHESWRRQIIVFKTAVYPFVVEDCILFIGVKPHSDDEISYLVVMDLRNGRVVREYPIDRRVGSLLVQTADRYPFYRDGYVVLQGHNDSLEPANVVVIKVDLSRLR
jgi:hypothetical protein